MSLLWKMASDSAVLTLIGSLFHNRGAITEKSHDFAKRPLFALTDGSISWPADKVEEVLALGLVV